MNEYKVTARKSGGAIIGTLIRGDNGTAAVRVVIPRYANGVDLAPLVWSVHVANASGAADVVIPAAVTADDASVMFEWLPGCVATAAAGMTEVHFEGVDEGALVWASATYHLRIDDKIDTTPSGEDAQKLTELQQLIVFVSGELNGVIEAGRAAQEAANRANEAAERAESIEGTVVDETLTRPGAAADAAVVGRKFDKLSEEIEELGGTGGASTPDKEVAPLGVELASSTGWTTDGWTGSFATGFKHTAGNTNPLIFAMPEATGTNMYQVTFTLNPKVTVEAAGAKEIWVSLGNSEYFDLYDQSNPYAVGIKSVSDGNLMFNVGTDYTGTISNVSIKRILGAFEAPAVFRDSDGEAAVEIRPTTADRRNLFMGINSGEMVTTGYANVGAGADALRNNTSGYRNIGIGSYAMESMTVGSRNAAIGHTAMRDLVDGQRNTAIGNAALTYLQHGHRNVAVGADSMYAVKRCSNNVAIGKAAMYSDGQGDENVAIGNYSMYKNTGKRNVAIGTEAQYNNADDGNIAIGYRAAYVKKAGAGNVVIGHQADSLGAKQSTQAGNVIIGTGAGAYLGDNCNSNVIIGRQAGQQLKSGSGNILIGGYVNAHAETLSNWINIGNVYQGSKANGQMYASIRGGLEVTELPTSDPGIAGRFWNDNGTVKVSAG